MVRFGNGIRVTVQVKVGFRFELRVGLELGFEKGWVSGNAHGLEEQRIRELDEWAKTCFSGNPMVRMGVLTFGESEPSGDLEEKDVTDFKGLSNCWV